MTNGKISFALQGRIYFIRLQGAVRYTISAGLDRLIERMMRDPDFGGVVIDLSGAEYLDSTNLGLLAKIAGHSILKLNEKPVLICSNEEVNTILESMGFDQAFHIVEDWEESALVFNDVTGVASHRPDADLLLEAHKTLSEMNEKNASTFKDVIDLFEADISDQQS